MDKCYCGCVSVVYRENKQVCLNCLVQKIVREEEAREKIV